MQYSTCWNTRYIAMLHNQWRFVYWTLFPTSSLHVSCSDTCFSLWMDSIGLILVELWLAGPFGKTASCNFSKIYKSGTTSPILARQRLPSFCVYLLPFIITVVHILKSLDGFNWPDIGGVMACRAYGKTASCNTKIYKSGTTSPILARQRFRASYTIHITVVHVLNFGWIQLAWYWWSYGLQGLLEKLQVAIFPKSISQEPPVQF